jgi:hypothetical protein
MKRDALKSFFRRTVVAALPLIAAGCGSSPGTGGPPGCGGGTNYVVANAELTDGGCSEVCTNPVTYSCQQLDGGVHCFTLCTGRQPEGLADAPRASGSAIGRWLADVAYLEAASVDAFRRLARELRACGAPGWLVDAAHAAARDEIRHARVTGRLARDAGSTPARPVRAHEQARSLEALAVENAREGCVRETFGALIATWQAEAARDHRIAAAMRTIAADETRHAELAWAVHRWALTQLDRAARTRVIAELRSTARAVVESAAIAPPDELVTLAGLPPPHVSAQLADQARRALWS